MTAGLLLPLLIWDPGVLRDTVHEKIFPGEDPAAFFWLSAVYTIVIHVPLEEIAWRAVILSAFRDAGFGEKSSIVINGLFFHALHALPLHLAGFTWGWLLAVPTGIAGAAWAWVRGRSGSMWPLLVSHAAVCLAILEVVRRFFIY